MQPLGGATSRQSAAERALMLSDLMLRSCYMHCMAAIVWLLWKDESWD